jgi:hypothetical protein
MPRKNVLNSVSGVSNAFLTESSATPIVNSLIATNNLKYDRDWELISEKEYAGGEDLGFKAFVFDMDNYPATYEYKLVLLNPGNMYTAAQNAGNSMIWWSNTNSDQDYSSAGTAANYNIQASQYSPLATSTQSDPTLMQTANGTNGRQLGTSNRGYVAKWADNNQSYDQMLVPWEIEFTFHLSKFLSTGSNTYNYLRFKYKETPARTEQQYIAEGHFNNFSSGQTESYKYLKIGTSYNVNFYSTNNGYPMGYKIYRRII